MNTFRLHTLGGRARRAGGRSAFTMIEIAISLAVIGFALVAIIGILPTGMNVQRDNRSETIINQDAIVLMNALRSGAQGLDDLTNYLDNITITTKELNRNMREASSVQVVYKYTGSTSPDDFATINGLRIVGLLSTPKYQPPFDPRNSMRSNYVTADFRAISGLASEKAPQNNTDVRELSFKYRVFVDVVPYTAILTNGFTPGYWDWNRTNYAAIADPADTNSINNAEFRARLEQARIMRNAQTNLYDIRLTFRWPVLPNGNVGNGRQVFRSLAGGRLLDTRDNPKVTPIYFLEPQTFVKAQ